MDTSNKLSDHGQQIGHAPYDNSPVFDGYRGQGDAWRIEGGRSDDDWRIYDEKMPVRRLASSWR